MRWTGPPDEALPHVVAEVYRQTADPHVRQFAIGRTDDPVVAFIQLRQTLQPPPTQMVILYEVGSADAARTVERVLRRLFQRDPRYRSLPTPGQRSKKPPYQYVYIVLWD
jgi:hypothetical protein